jgi:hypothetical protein
MYRRNTRVMRESELRKTIAGLPPEKTEWDRKVRRQLNERADELEREEAEQARLEARPVWVKAAIKLAKSIAIAAVFGGLLAFFGWKVWESADGMGELAHWTFRGMAVTLLWGIGFISVARFIVNWFEVGDR